MLLSNVTFLIASFSKENQDRHVQPCSALVLSLHLKNPEKAIRLKNGDLP